MTREEAIRIFRKEIECLSHAKCEDCILEKVCDPAKTTPLDSEYIEAYGMAIQALSQEPCDDATSRILKRMWNCRGKHTTSIDKVAMEQIIRDELSVTQKSGKWIMSDDGLYRPICDKCGAHPWKGYIPTVEEATEVFKYCPNCGAKMESEDKK